MDVRRRLAVVSGQQDLTEVCAWPRRLLTHAGLTLACWQQLGEPVSAAVAAALLDDRPDLIWRTGDHGRDGRAGPPWAESGAALHEPWMGYRGIVPFGQIHGHSTIVHFGDRRWRCTGRVRQRATVDWDARHVRVRIGPARSSVSIPGTAGGARRAGDQWSWTARRSAT